jgi:hypothetical protein
MTCANEDGVKVYRLPAGIFEMNEQLLVPERTSLVGARAPNVVSDLGMTPDWSEQTLFLATRGATDYHMNYCLAQDMVSTRVGFVLSSYASVYNLSFQGIDTIRPGDNGALCGGGAFETKGCAANDCRASNVNNGGSDGIGSVHVTIENVRINDFHYAEDRNRIGASIEGNYDCKGGCCFCKPNEVRSSQVGVWVPETRNPEGTHDLVLRSVVSRSTQADGINLHGYVNNTLVENTLVENTGDDVFVLCTTRRRLTRSFIISFIIRSSLRCRLRLRCRSPAPARPCQSDPEQIRPGIGNRGPDSAGRGFPGQPAQAAAPPPGCLVQVPLLLA